MRPRRTAGQPGDVPRASARQCGEPRLASAGTSRRRRCRGATPRSRRPQPSVKAFSPSRFHRSAAPVTNTARLQRARGSPTRRAAAARSTPWSRRSSVPTSTNSPCRRRLVPPAAECGLLVACDARTGEVRPSSSLAKPPEVLISGSSSRGTPKTQQLSSQSRFRAAKERARGIGLVSPRGRGHRQLPEQPRVDGAEREAVAVVLVEQPPSPVAESTDRVQPRARTDAARPAVLCTARPCVGPVTRSRSAPAAGCDPRQRRRWFVIPIARCAALADRKPGGCKHALPDLLRVLDPARPEGAAAAPRSLVRARTRGRRRGTYRPLVVRGSSVVRSRAPGEEDELVRSVVAPPHIIYDAAVRDEVRMNPVALRKRSVESISPPHRRRKHRCRSKLWRTLTLVTRPSLDRADAADLCDAVGRGSRLPCLTCRVAALEDDIHRGVARLRRRNVASQSAPRAAIAWATFPVIVARSTRSGGNDASRRGSAHVTAGLTRATLSDASAGSIR